MVTTAITPICSVKPSKGNKACLCNEYGVLYTGTLAQCYKIKQKIEKCKRLRNLNLPIIMNTVRRGIK